MTRMKELESLSAEKLQSKLVELKKDLMKQNTQVASGTVPTSPGQLKQTKKTIAKILTLLNQRENKMKTESIKA